MTKRKYEADYRREERSNPHQLTRELIRAPLSQPWIKMEARALQFSEIIASEILNFVFGIRAKFSSGEIIVA